MTINKVGLKFGNMALRKVTELLVLHHQGATARQTVKQIHDYHKNSKGWAGIGYHFYVRTNGEIWQGRPLEYVGAHAYGFNDNSIGICFEGNFEVEEMSEAQKEAGKWLVSYILNKYPTIKNIKGHRDLMATACPGKNFPFDEIAKGKPLTTSPTNPKTSSATVTVGDWQNAAIKDGFKFPKYGADNKWGKECEEVANKAVCKNRGSNFKYKNLTRIVQKKVGVTVDGLYGSDTANAVKEYQRNNGLTADGVVGIKTWKSFLNVK